jgi:ribosomal protein S4
MSAVSNIRTPYRPRYALSYRTRTKVWPNKNSRLRRLVSLRGRRLQRGGLFRRYVLVATTLKWTEARRQIRPIRRRGGAARTAGITAFGRPRRRRYRDSASAAQQVRSFAGKRSARALRQLVRRGVGGGMGGAGTGSASFFAALASRLDRVVFRIRLMPTVVAAHQFIHHQGISVNGRLAFSPRRLLQPGDTVSLRPDSFVSKDSIDRRLSR